MIRRSGEIFCSPVDERAPTEVAATQKRSERDGAHSRALRPPESVKRISWSGPYPFDIPAHVAACAVMTLLFAWPLGR